MSGLSSSKRSLGRAQKRASLSAMVSSKKPLSRKAALALFSPPRSPAFFIKRSFRPPVGHPVAPPKAKLHPYNKAPPFVRKLAIGVASSLIAFSPLKSRAMDSREPPPNPAWYSNTGCVQILDKRQWGSENNAFGFDCFRFSFGPKAFGITNSGPVITYEHMFNRASPDTVRVGISQRLFLSKDTVLKLGAFSPVLTDKIISAKDSRFGVIFVHGPVSLEYFYRGLVGKEPAQGGGASIDIAKGVTAGIGIGSKGYVDSGESVRYGLRFTQIERKLGLKEGALLNPAVDFGFTRVRGAKSEVDFGLLLNPSKNLSFGVDAYDINSSVGKKSGAKIAGILILKF